MAKYGSDDVGFLLVDGYDILGVQTELRFKKMGLKERTDGLGDSWEEVEHVGVKSAELMQQGFFDTGTNLAHQALNEQQGVSRIVCFGVEGNTIGQTFIGAVGFMQMDYERVASRAEFTKANAMYEVDGAVEEGKILHDHSAETAAGNTESSSVDNSASSADGGSAYLQVSALTLGGYDDLTVNVRHSSDNMSFSTKDSFTAVTSAPDKERLSLSGTINQYTAVSWTFSGTGSDPSATFMVGLYRA